MDDALCLNYYQVPHKPEYRLIKLNTSKYNCTQVHGTFYDNQTLQRKLLELN